MISDEEKACNQTANIRMNTIFSFILVAPILLSALVSSYKILLMPLTGKSHIFSLAVVAEQLADRGHSVTFFVGEGFRLNEAAVKDWTKINVVRYKDSLDDVPMDYDGMFSNITRSIMEKQASVFEVALLIRK